MRIPRIPFRERALLSFIFTIVLLALATTVPAANVTIPDSIVVLATNLTKNYTFTDATSGESVTVAVTISPYSTNGPAVFTQLDFQNGYPTRVAISGGDGTGNWVDPSESVNFTASLVSASTGVATNSVRFGIASIGLRPNSGAANWNSSADSKSMSLPGEMSYALDATTASLAATNYTGQLTPTGILQLSDAYALASNSIVFNATFSLVNVAVGAQVNGVTTSSAPSLLSLSSNEVLIAANFGGSTLVRDGITFTGIAASSNPITNTFGPYTLTILAPSGNLSTANFGDELFGTFIWADNQEEMSVKIDGLNTDTSYQLYYLAGDNRSLAFNMFVTVEASTTTDTNSVASAMSWGGSSANNIYYAYLPATVSNATSITATMMKNGSSSGVAFSGVVLTETKLSAPTITVADSKLCSGSAGHTASGPGGMDYYAWTIHNGQITSAANSQTVTYTAGTSGEVRLDLTVSRNGSSASNVVYVPIQSGITAVSVNTPSGICSGTSGSATVNATAAFDTTDDQLGIITARGENETGEGAAKAFDNNTDTKWLDFTGDPTNRSSWIQYQYAHNGQHIVTKYNLTSANDGPVRDPRDWKILGSNDGGTNWVTLDTRVGQLFSNRFEKQTFTFANDAAYNIYRLQIDSVRDPANATCVQLAELEFIETPALSYGWSITNGSFIGGTNAQSVIYTPGSSGNVGLSVSVRDSGSCSSLTMTTNVAINNPPGIAIAASSPCANSTGNQASGPAGMAAYAWSISNGTITSATNIQTITYTAGASGVVGLTLLITSAEGCSSGDYTETTISPYPTATITTSSNVLANSSGNSASAPSGMSSYSWQITNGTITSDSNLQTITYTAGTNGNVGLVVYVSNNSGCVANTSINVPITVPPPLANPRTISWMTNYAGQYVRLYTNSAAMNAGVTVTTWTFTTIGSTNVTGSQSLPVYSGIQEVYSSSNWVYIRSSAMPVGPIGPLIAYGNAALFLPYNQKSLYRIPINPGYTNIKSLTTGGAIGYLVDGVQMYDTRDALSWTGSNESQGTGYWTRDAYINEGYGFDPYQGHSSPAGAYHYHANPQGLRYLLNDHVDYKPATKTYSESTNVVTKHSPIIGWMRDGYPLYGPYGYSSASNSASGIRRMLSGFVLRNGQNGTVNLSTVGRTNIPPWAQRMYGTNNVSGPSVASYGPLGRYLEDSDFMGDLINPSTGSPFVKGVDYDLDEYNGRWCVTPEFPNGTYAYFVTIETNGAPKYPYYVGRALFGIPTGGSVSNISETVVTNFLGGTNMPLQIATPAKNGNLVTLTWSGVDGGTYKVESSTNLPAWTILSTNASAPRALGAYTNVTTDMSKFYRVSRTAVAAFDNTGTTVFTTSSVAPGGSASRGSTVTVTITLPSTPPNPPTTAIPTSVTLAGSISGTSLSHPTGNTVLATFAIPANATTGAQNIVVTFNPNPVYTLTNSFTILP